MRTSDAPAPPTIGAVAALLCHDAVLTPLTFWVSHRVRHGPPFIFPVPLTGGVVLEIVAWATGGAVVLTGFWLALLKACGVRVEWWVGRPPVTGAALTATVSGLLFAWVIWTDEAEQTYFALGDLLRPWLR